MFLFFTLLLVALPFLALLFFPGLLFSRLLLSRLLLSLLPLLLMTLLFFPRPLFTFLLFPLLLFALLLFALLLFALLLFLLLLLIDLSKRWLNRDNHQRKTKQDHSTASGLPNQIFEVRESNSPIARVYCHNHRPFLRSWIGGLSTVSCGGEMQAALGSIGS